MSIEYGAPTDLNGTYDPLLAQVDLTWTASVDGVTELFTTDGTFTTDATSDHVLVTLLGAGAGGNGGAAASGGWVCAGGGGAYIQASYTSSTLPSTVAVTVGVAGVGGVGATGTGKLVGLGTNGGNTIFAGYLSAGGGAAALAVNTAGGLGGVATVLSSTGLIGSAITESGGAGGGPSTIGVLTPNGASTTYAGPGGGSGARNSGSGAAGPNGGNGGSCANGGTGGIGGTGSTGPGAPGSTGTALSSSVIIGGGAGGGAGGQSDFYTPSDGAPGAAGAGYGAGGGSGAAPATRGGSSPVGGNGGNGGNGVLETVTYWAHSHDPYYLVYRNGVLLTVTAQGATSFDDLSPLAGVNTYTVYASYDGTTLNSAASDPVTVTISSGKVYVSGKFSPANAFAPIMLINLKGVKPKFYPPVINPNMRSRR